MLSNVYKDGNNLYRTALQIPDSTAPYVFSVTQGTTYEGYSKTPVFSVSQDGKITASNAVITGGKIGDWKIRSGYIETNNSNGYRGISMNKNAINFYSWYDNEENFVGGLTSGVSTDSGSIKDRRLILFSDYGDKLRLSYMKQNDSTKYSSIEVNHDNAGSIYFYEKIDSDIRMKNNAHFSNPSNQEFILWGNNEGRGLFFGVDYNSDGSVKNGWNFRPCQTSGVSNVPDLGVHGNPWDAIYTRSGVSETSDRNRKNSIQELDEETCLQLTQKLIPSSYILNEGTSGRRHYGFIAQDVEAVLKELGIDTQDFAALIKSKKNDSNGYEYSLRYNEFIPVAFKSLQYCLKMLKEQQEEINKLKSM